MPSDVDIVNLALVKLGQQRITLLTETGKAARSANAIYTLERDGELRDHNWNFAIKRVQLAALTTQPPFGYQWQYQLPDDYDRAIAVGWVAPGAELAIYRGGMDQEFYKIESGKILWGRTFQYTQAVPSRITPSALPLRYCAKITDPNAFDPSFVRAFAARLAMELAEDLTQQGSKRQLAQGEYKEAIIAAIRSNAIEMAPSQLDDGSWLRSRLPG